MAEAFDYSKMAATASRLMERFRQGLVTVERRTANTTRPDDLPIWQPWTPEETVRQYRLDAVVRVVEFKYIDKENIRATDQQVTCPDKMTLYAVDGVVVDEAEAEEVAFDVDLLNTLVIDGVSMTVLQKIPTPGAGTKIVHKFIVRAGGPVPVSAPDSGDVSITDGFEATGSVAAPSLRLVVDNTMAGVAEMAVPFRVVSIDAGFTGVGELAAPDVGGDLDVTFSGIGEMSAPSRTVAVSTGFAGAGEMAAPARMIMQPASFIGIGEANLPAVGRQVETSFTGIGEFGSATASVSASLSAEGAGELSAPTRTVAIASGFFGVGEVDVPEVVETIDPPAFIAASSGVDTTTINKPAGVAEGDFLLGIFYSFSADTGGTVSPPPGWTAIGTMQQQLDSEDGVYTNGIAARKVAGPSEPASYTFSNGGGSAYPVGSIIAYSGVDAADPVEAFQYTKGDGASVDIPSLDSSVSNSLLLVMGTNFVATCPTPSGMTQRLSYDGGIRKAWDEVLSVAGASGSKSTPLSGTNPSYMYLAAILNPAA